jgi:hypothetical protein
VEWSEELVTSEDVSMSEERRGWGFLSGRAWEKTFLVLTLAKTMKQVVGRRPSNLKLIQLSKTMAESLAPLFYSPRLLEGGFTGWLPDHDRAFSTPYPSPKESLTTHQILCHPENVERCRSDDI